MDATAASSQAARDRWEPRYRAYHAWMQVLLKATNPDLPDYLIKPFNFEWLTTKGPAIVGSPAEFVDRLEAMTAMLDIDLHLIKLDMGGMPESEYLEMIELMGADVLPALSS
jgi:hypothetical protein